jgi:hypothetical protein
MPSRFVSAAGNTQVIRIGSLERGGHLARQATKT